MKGDLKMNNYNIYDDLKEIIKEENWTVGEGIQQTEYEQIEGIFEDDQGEYKTTIRRHRGTQRGCIWTEWEEII